MHMRSYRIRRLIALITFLILIAVPFAGTTVELPTLEEVMNGTPTNVPGDLAALPMKGRAPKTGYARTEFGNGWSESSGCDTRNQILSRDLKDVTISADCKVENGTLIDPYTGRSIRFVRGTTTSDDVQIDHVVALSNAWQTGAQQISYDRRVEFANDPLNLLAVDGPTNEKKGDGDAATWLPPNKPFRCQYVTRQIDVKTKYGLWVTQAERAAMARVLGTC